MKALFAGINLFVASVIGVACLASVLQHFYSGIYSEIGRALLSVTANLAGR